MKRLISIFMIACMMNLLLIGCGEVDQPSDNRIVDPPTELESESYTFTPCDGEPELEVMKMGMYLYDDGGYSDITNALSLPEIQYTIDHFALDGYEFDPANSFVVMGSAVPEGYQDTVDVKITKLILRYLPDSTEKFIEISHIACINMPELPEVTVTTVNSFVEPNTDEIADYDQFKLGVDDQGVERSLWVKNYMSPYSQKGDNNFATLFAFDEEAWRNCVLTKSISGCVGAMIGCLATGPGYLLCVTTGCLAAHIAAGVYCTLDMFLR